MTCLPTVHCGNSTLRSDYHLVSQVRKCNSDISNKKYLTFYLTQLDCIFWHNLHSLGPATASIQFSNSKTLTTENPGLNFQCSGKEIMITIFEFATKKVFLL